MERTCRVCKQSKNTPYRDICRNCYQRQWATTVVEKKCSKCLETFKKAGEICWKCRQNERNDKTREHPCSSCGRVGLILRNTTERLCIKCNRHKLESADPSRAEKRRDYLMKYSRKKKGTDLDAPRRVKKSRWKTAAGYILIYKPKHANADVNGCIREHTFVMSEKMGRPLTRDENVHHINGIKDDNRIENLELWSSSHPSGQRVQDKIKWAKEILTKYADLC